MSVQRKPFKKKISKKKSGPLRAALIVVLLMLAAAVLLGAVLVLAPLIERADPTPVEGSADWMRRVDDETPLNEIVLPGTHASAAVHTPRAFFTKTQSLNITEQLKAGFRLLDLQLAATEGGSGFRLLYEGSDVLLRQTQCLCLGVARYDVLPVLWIEALQRIQLYAAYLGYLLQVYALVHLYGV